MKRLSLLVAVLVLAVMVSSVSADEVNTKPTPILLGSEVTRDVGGAEHIVVDLSTNPEGDTPGKATPILF
jgi:hypothetical protein